MKTENPSGNESIDTADTTDYAPAAVDGATVQSVGLAIWSDTISGRAYLDAEMPATVADEHAAVAADAWGGE